MTRRGTGVVGAALVASLLAVSACGSGPDSASGSNEVRMLVNLTDNLTQEYWNELVQPFEEQTGIDVRIEGPTGTNVSETFSSQLAAGTGPDVIQSIFPDEQIAPELVDLTGETWVADTPMVDTYAMEGKHLVAGIGSQAQSLVYYNKTAFEEAGIEATPQTWEEFSDALAKLADAGYTPLQTAGQWQTGLQLQQLSHPTVNTLHPRWQSAVSAGELTLGQVFQPMFERYATWIEAGYVQQSDVGLDPSTADANFIGGKVGMYPLGSWLVASIDNAGELPFEVGVFSPPVEEGMSYPGPQGATMASPYMVYAGSERTDNALQLVKYLVTDQAAIESQLVQDGVFRTGTAVQTSPVGQEIQQIVDEAPELVAVGEGAGDTRLPVVGLNDKFTEITQSLYTGTSPADAAAELDAWAEQNR
ncbi:ABC transporter substrate-binding protein [Desertihabitans aurantiacus]|uniref:ABC transporter substrate-binding protein n=1 Tax=Desertihabitans aurantiacus TaxID=2282477 RepID=UPI000DF7DDAF|nr:ABC transporter substrate-binding protein [Desertihabitans aurantiacus]